MDTWKILSKELNYYGIRLIDNTKCQICDENGDIKVQGVIKTIRILNNYVRHQKKLLLKLWNEVVETLEQEQPVAEMIDENMSKLFIFSLKDFAKYLLCFDGYEKSKYNNAISLALTRDIKTFSKDQIYSIPEYKISIDWITRNICRLLYISKLLAFACMGKNRVSQYDLKTAKGIAGPWSRLELPIEERMFPFGHGLKEREKGKQKQRRYTKGLQNYNNSPQVGEGHYWRELRNEPFSWFDRNFEDPYPSRHLLSR